MKLCEIAKQQNPHADIKKWLKQQEIKKYTIRPNGVVDVDGHVDLIGVEGEYTIPVQFGKVTGHFCCSGTNILSLKGSPQIVHEQFVCSHTNITSLAGAPQSIGGNCICLFTQMTSLSGVDKIIKQIDGKFTCDMRVTHLLGLLLIKGITGFVIDQGGPIDEIMNWYAGTGDILSAQDKLIDAGFIDQARL